MYHHTTAGQLAGSFISWIEVVSGYTINLGNAGLHIKVEEIFQLEPED
jgi:hypothetical protein